MKKYLFLFTLSLALFPQWAWAWTPFTIENQESTPQKIKLECATPDTIELAPQKKQAVTPTKAPCKLTLLVNNAPSSTTYLAMPDEVVAVTGGDFKEVTPPKGYIKVLNKDAKEYYVELACFGRTTQQPIPAGKEVPVGVFNPDCTLTLMDAQPESKLHILEVSAQVNITGGKLVRMDAPPASAPQK